MIGLSYYPSMGKWCSCLPRNHKQTRAWFPSRAHYRWLSSGLDNPSVPTSGKVITVLESPTSFDCGRSCTLIPSSPRGSEFDGIICGITIRIRIPQAHRRSICDVVNELAIIEEADTPVCCTIPLHGRQHANHPPHCQC